MPEIRNLTIQQRVSGRTLVSDLSFTIQAGDRIAIIGEEGNGKSTLLKYLYDPALVAPYADVTGSVRMDGRRAGFLYQELPETEQSKSVCDFLTGRGAFDTAADSELLRRASELGLAPERIYSEQRVSTLSGGEKVKLQLLAVLAGRPDLLMLDEPTNDIDIETLQYLTEFLLHTPLPVLYVSHDETLLEDTATAVIHLEQLHLKTECRSGFYRLPYRVYVESRMSAFQRQEQRARKEAAEYRAKVERYRRLFERVQADQNRISRGDPHGGRLLKKKMHAVKAAGRRLESEEKRLTALPVFEDAIKLAFPPILQPRGKEILRCSLPELSVAGRVLCRNVELVVHGGEHVGIFGKNGVGKTTLLAHIAEELLARSDVRTFYMPQNYAELLPRGCTSVGFLAPDGDKAAVTAARLLLGSAHFTREEMLAPIGALSGGQRAKLCLLRPILSGADVLILDEPTRNFSPLSNPVIRGILRGYGGAILSVSHDRKYLLEVTETLYRQTPKGLRREW